MGIYRTLLLKSNRKQNVYRLNKNSRWRVIREDVTTFSTQEGSVKRSYVLRNVTLNAQPSRMRDFAHKHALRVHASSLSQYFNKLH